MSRAAPDASSGVPGWLREPPSSVPRPVVVTQPQLLPFGELTPENFERLVLRLAERLGAVEHAQLYGDRGQAQHGIDLYCRLAAPGPSGRRYVTIQCRNVTETTARDLTAALDDFLGGMWAERSDKFIFATRASGVRVQRAEAIEAAAARLLDAQISFEVWDGEQLSERLRHEPDLVKVFFGEPTMLIFCDTQYRARSEHPSPPIAVSDLPIRLAARPEYMVGRQLLLAELHRRLTEPETSPRLVALHGLGGVGKTSTALEYAYRHQEEYRLIWQLSAENPATLSAGFTELAEILGVRNSGSEDRTDPVLQVHSALATREGRWLLILDNATDPASVRAVLPPLGNGHIVITTRYAYWPAPNALPISVLERFDSVSFLMGRTRDSDQIAADSLADLLGDLPLALEQAGAYIVATSCGLVGYIELFHEFRSELLERGWLSNYDASVATTWLMAFDELNETAPNAITLLRLLAIFAVYPVPLDPLLLPRQDLNSELNTGVAEQVQRLMANQISVNDAVVELGRYSLASQPMRGAIAIHRLVRAVTIDRIPDGQLADWRKVAAALLREVLPADPKRPDTWPIYQRLIPQALAILPATDMHRIVTFLIGIGNYDTARVVQEHICDDVIQRVGRNSSEVAVEFATFFYIVGEAGNPAEARDGFAGLLNGCRDRAPDDPFILLLRSNVARWTGAAGDPATACDIYADLLPIMERVFGPTHPRTLTAKYNYAAWIADAGDPVKSRDLYITLLPAYEEKFGLTHPETLGVQANLAFITGMAGDPQRACELYADLIPVMETILGPAHPKTLVDRTNLAYITAQVGDLASAYDQLANVYTTLKRVRGSEHPDTINIRDYLDHLAAVIKEKDAN
jgi:hypothetical protein